MELELVEKTLIDDAPALEGLLETLAGAHVLAIDTEFVRERTYVPNLCLIQVATKSFSVCIDCVAGLDLGRVLELLTAPDRSWVLHSARQDLEVIWNSSGRLPARLIDTQVAGALVGLAPQLSLQDLLADLLDVHLDKHHTRADWARRPLPDAALRYALDDVRYLLAAWKELEGRLQRLGRVDWFEEDCRRLIDEPPLSDPIAIARRIRGLGGLSLEQKAAIVALVSWRETRARKLDRPRRWILGDDALISIARRLPADPRELADTAQVPAKLAARASADILAALAERSRHAEIAAKLEAGQRPDKALLAMLKDEVKRRAAELGIHPEVLATRKDLAAIATGDTPDAFRTGWRSRQLKSLAVTDG